MVEAGSFTVPESIRITGKESTGLLNLAISERINGALSFGVFGHRTYRYSGKDIDIIVIKDGIQRGGVTLKNGIYHMNYFPTNILSDPIATFGKQAYRSAVFIYNFLEI